MTNFTFKKYYNGFEPGEDEEILKGLKRQITSYIKENTLSRLHGIFNKIYILRKSLPKDKFYDILTEGLTESEKREFIEYILKEGFDIIVNEDVKPKKIWEHQLEIILEKYKK